MHKDIILAGVARSGSTLVCHLLNKSQGVVALHEPIQPALVPSSSNEEAISYIQEFFISQRHSIVNKGVAKSASTSGGVPDNHIGCFDKVTGKRKFLLDGNEITINKKLSDNFTLLIKQPGLFTAILGALKNHFSCYATIRNPLAILRSWNSVDMAVTNGHAPAAENRDSQLKNDLALEPDLYKRQLILLSWYYKQYYYHLANDHIIRYEEVINTGGKSLLIIDSSALQLNEQLTNKNNNKLYDASTKNDLARILLDSNGYYWKFYSKQDVLDLLDIE